MVGYMIFKIKIAVLSHPTELVSILVYVPDVVYDTPFHVYGNLPEQIFTFLVPTVALFTVRTNVDTVIVSFCTLLV